MDRKKYKFAFILVKSLAISVIAFFTVYFILDLSLSLQLSSLEKDYRNKYESFSGKCALPEKAANAASTAELEVIIKKAGFSLRNMGAGGNTAQMDNFFMMNHRYLEENLEVPEDTIITPAGELSENLEILKDYSRAIRELLLRNNDPLWSEDNSQSIHLLKIGQIGEWLAVEALKSFQEGDREESALFAEALCRLSRSLLANRYQIFWFTSISLAQTYSGVLRKTGNISKSPDPPGLDISPYYKALQGTILTQAERLIGGAGKMGKIHYYKVNRREKMLWRTYGRLWYRYSLIREIKSRLRDYEDSENFLCCGSLQQIVVPVIHETVWMMNGAEFRIDDLRFRIQKLSLSFEFTKWILTQKGGPADYALKGLMNCPQIKTVKKEEGDTILIGYTMPFKSKTHQGVIDMPTYYQIKN
jgi:hypothetical protein